MNTLLIHLSTLRQGKTAQQQGFGWSLIPFLHVINTIFARH